MKPYIAKLNSYELQQAISFIKDNFQAELSKNLNLKRVSAPLFVSAESGLNDNLNGTERPVSFDIPTIGKDAQVVHSLAKWKRLALKKYNFSMYEGLYTDMNAIRRDEDCLDNIHSVYVDQWDWEKIIDRKDRNVEFLKETVQNIVNSLCDVNDMVREKFPQISLKIEREISFITSQELEDLYPNLTPEQREQEYSRNHHTAFIMQIGGALKSGVKHGGRAPDYDDWSLNGDIFVWNDVIERAFEVSSMGIRVDETSLLNQLTISNNLDRKDLPFHKMLLNNELPLTIGGGIGQSRVCMLLLECAHIGEVQCSIWDDKTIEDCKALGIRIL